MQRYRHETVYVGGMRILLLVVTLIAGACRVERAAADRAEAPVDASAAVAIDASGGGGAPAEPKGPTCTKGCPCGNSCISCSKTCHVGTGTAKKKRGK